jgi:hypothetical protein
MNTQPQLQQEIENHKKVLKVLKIALYIVLTVAATLFCVYLSKHNEQPEPQKTEQPPICPECDSIPLKWHIYPDSTKGTLTQHPITRERGILIDTL